MIALQYLDEIEKTDLKEIFEDEESHIVEINDGECGFSFGDDDEILRISTEIFNELNFYNVQYVQEYGKPTWYWCGILCEFPSGYGSHHCFYPLGMETGVKKGINSSLRNEKE